VFGYNTTLTYPKNFMPLSSEQKGKCCGKLRIYTSVKRFFFLFAFRKQYITPVIARSFRSFEGTYGIISDMWVFGFNEGIVDHDT
jgi:hypothetical protein